MFSHRSDCRKYFVCHNGQHYEQQCPSNLYWSESHYRCDYRQFSNCNDVSGNQEVYYRPYPRDCSRFEEIRVLRCEGNRHWSPSLQRCENPQFAGCQDVIPTAGTPPPGLEVSTNLPVDPQELCRGSVANAYIPYPADCNKFIHCGPKATVLTCPGNLFWNPTKLACTIDAGGCQLLQ
ncbi:hypothetical protein KR018_004000 [Drosophila ironensis]|nr:hypothetical protein KR018_004000 [Drosophila ironensis]